MMEPIVIRSGTKFYLLADGKKYELFWPMDLSPFEIKINEELAIKTYKEQKKTEEKLKMIKIADKIQSLMYSIFNTSR